MKISVNNRLILEQYIKEGLKAKMQGGIATPGQRDGLKGLKVLMDTTLSDGRHVTKGSTAYVREEVLHTHPWASKPLTCDTIPDKFMIVELTYVEILDILEFGA
jgi:hypothetical protein